MKKYIPLHADVSDFQQAMRDVLREEKVLTQKDRETIPTIKEIEKTLEMYPTKEDLKRELHIALKPYATKDDLKNHPTKDDLKKALEPYATKNDLRQEFTAATGSVMTEIKKLRKDLMIAGILSPSSTL